MRHYPRFAIWSILILVGALYAVVDANVDFFEKHAPKINAAIHSGEITSEGDASYVVGKWNNDIEKLNADLKGEGWVAIRQELLTRKPYLDDLVAQNEKFQRRVKVESDAHVDVNDPCEGLAMHEAAPLMLQYTRLFTSFYLLMERAETATPEISAKIDEVTSEQSAIERRLSDFGDHWKAKGCK